jgi:DNA-binding IclR family transcriptional regulator
VVHVTSYADTSYTPKMREDRFGQGVSVWQTDNVDRAGTRELSSDTKADNGTPRPNAAGRLLGVLDAFGPRHRALSLSDISRRAGLSLSTAHRLVNELAGWGALERDAAGRYSIGLRLLELAALAPRGLELREAAFPYLDELHRRTCGNVHLGVRDGLEVVYVETLRTRTDHPITSRIGDRWPMHATGTGLVLLALGERELQEQVLHSPLERFTPLTITDPGELRRRLARVRQAGVAVARGQITVPNLVVAVPVFGPFGELAAAISVVVDVENARPDVLAVLLTEASRAISRTLAPQVRQRDTAPARPRGEAGPVPEPRESISGRGPVPASAARCSR